MRQIVPAVALIVGFSAGGCLVAGVPSPYQGLQRYEKGQVVTVCRDAYTAPTRKALEEAHRQGGPIESPPTGQTVRIIERDLVQPFGPYIEVARVEPTDSDASYWISYRALCAKG